MARAVDTAGWASGMALVVIAGMVSAGFAVVAVAGYVAARGRASTVSGMVGAAVAGIRAAMTIVAVLVTGVIGWVIASGVADGFDADRALALAAVAFGALCAVGVVAVYRRT